MELTLDRITLDDLANEIDHKTDLGLNESCIALVKKCREYLNTMMETHDKPIYGINTGFGALYNRSIDKDQLSQLQVNLIRSHACGMGETVPAEIVRLMLLLKVRGLSYGHSGVSLETIDRLMFLYNRDLLPVIYQQGSLGASGDLAPLAHMALTLLNEGQVWNNGSISKASEVLQNQGVNPIELQSKEGLALLNGTQFMSAYATWCTIESKKLSAWSDVIGALSLEAFDGRPEPFIHEVHAVRNHRGQIDTAQRMRGLFEGSELITRHKTHVQDPYSFRCIPQVHGATKDTLAHIESVIEDEINAVTDNPTIFPDQDLVVSAGNFHGQPLALVLDQLSIAMAELGSISERRTYKLISGQRELPPFLVGNPGLNSGFMIPQYTAASIVSQNKTLCTPSSVDTIDSSNGQEDHVSMGANSATKAYRVVSNVKSILAIEILNAAQAIEFRRPAKSSPALESLVSDFRNHVNFVDDDEEMHGLMKKSVAFLDSSTPDKY